MIGNTKKCSVEGCSNPIWGNGLCIKHKPRKAMKSSRITFRKAREFNTSPDINKMRNFFVDIWRKRPHRSEISGTYLGQEPLTVFFHHILPKEKHPEAAFDEENIILLTLDEHTNVEFDMYKYEEVNRRRELLKAKYEGTK
jgi:hypothetical protein